MESVHAKSYSQIFLRCSTAEIDDAFHENRNLQRKAEIVLQYYRRRRAAQAQGGSTPLESSHALLCPLPMYWSSRA